MTVFRNRRAGFGPGGVGMGGDLLSWGAAGILVTSLGFCSMAPVWAQDAASGAPRGLTPPDEQLPPVEAPAAPPAQGTAPAVAPGPRTLAPTAGMPAGSAIEMQSLSAPDPSGFGTLRIADGGFGANLWAGSSSGAIRERLGLIVPLQRSPVMRDLTRKLLLSANTGLLDRPGPGELTILSLRIERLIAAGMLTGAIALARLAPQTDMAALSMQIEALLLSARDAEACEALNRLKVEGADGVAMKRRTFCALASGNTAAAQLSLDVMREKSVTDDAFFHAVSVLTDGAKPLALELPQPSGVHLALFRKSNLQIPASLLDLPYLPGVQILAAGASTPQVRLAGTMRAAAAGLIPITEAVEAAGAAAFDVNQLDDPEELAQKLSVGEGDALFFQAVRKRTIPAAQSAAFAAMLARAEGRGEFPYAARLLKDAAAALQPLPETAWAAPIVARVLIETRQVARAEDWLQALSFASPSDRPVINAIQIHAWLAASSPKRAETAASAMKWLADEAAKEGPNRVIARARLAREIPIIAALGLVVPPEASIGADNAGPSLDQSTRLDEMERAAAQDRLGETVLNAILGLNGQSAASAPGRSVARVVRALRDVGLSSEARALAIEAVTGGYGRP